MSYFRFINHVPDFPVLFRIEQAGMLRGSICVSAGGHVHMPFQDRIEVTASVTLDCGHFTSGTRRLESSHGTALAQAKLVHGGFAFYLATRDMGQVDCLRLRNTTNRPVIFRVVRRMGPLFSRLICPPGAMIPISTELVFRFQAQINGFTTAQLTTTDSRTTVIAFPDGTGYGISFARES